MRSSVRQHVSVCVCVLFLCISHGASTWSVVNLIFGACTNMCSPPAHTPLSLFPLALTSLAAAFSHSLHTRLHSQTPQTLPLNSHTHTQAGRRARHLNKTKKEQQQQRTNCKAPFFHMTWLIRGWQRRRQRQRQRRQQRRRQQRKVIQLFLLLAQFKRRLRCWRLSV